MVREGLRLALVAGVLAWLLAPLPRPAFLWVVGIVPGLWWSRGAWEADDVDLWASLGVVAIATAVVWAVVPAVRLDVGLFAALLVGTQLARIRILPPRIDTVDAETWARLNAHRYRPGRPGMPAPDLSSSDPYALVTGLGRGRVAPVDPYAGVPDEHHVFVRGDPS
jgi:hypothetical protein